MVFSSFFFHFPFCDCNPPKKEPRHFPCSDITASLDKPTQRRAERTEAILFFQTSSLHGAVQTQPHLGRDGTGITNVFPTSPTRRFCFQNVGAHAVFGCQNPITALTRQNLLLRYLQWCPMLYRVRGPWQLPEGMQG